MTKIQLCLLSGILFSSTVYSAPYTLTDLGELSEEASFATAINNNGLVVGDFQGAVDSGTHAFSFDGTIFKDLLTLTPATTTLSSNALGMNDSGQIVGFSQLNVSEVVGEFELGGQGFIYENDLMTSLGLPEAVESNGSSALDINNLGIVVGSALTQLIPGDDASGFGNQAVIIDPTAVADKFTLLGTLIDPSSSVLGESAARNINELGQIVGWSNTEEDGVLSFVHSFYIDPLRTNQMVDAGTLGGLTSHPKDINNLGVMVGRSQLEDNTVRAFKFDILNDTNMVNLGTLQDDFPGSLANAVNGSNQIVGASIFATSIVSSSFHAVLFENDTVIDLNQQIDCSLGWTLIVATDINDAGQIVGSGLINGKTRGFLLTPDANGGAAEVCEDTTPERKSSGGETNLGLLLLLLLTSIGQRLRLD